MVRERHSFTGIFGCTQMSQLQDVEDYHRALRGPVMEWWGLTVLDMLNVIGNLCVMDKASIICLIKRLVGTRTSS